MAKIIPIKKHVKPKVKELSQKAQNFIKQMKKFDSRANVKKPISD